MRRVLLLTGALIASVAGCRDYSFDVCSGGACDDAQPDSTAQDVADAFEDSTADVEDSSVTDTSDSSNEDAPDTTIEDTSLDADADLDAADSAVDAPPESSSDVGDTSIADVVADVVADAVDADTKADAPSSCEAGTFVCGAAGGNELKKCETDGGLSTVVTCPSAATCSASLGRCTACTPGAFSCVGAERKQCDAFGATTTTVATCATPELCAASTGGTCATPVCAVGEKRCGTPASKSVEVCNAGRTGWISSETCTIGCSAGACLKVSALASSSSSGDHVCVLLSDATVRCWGRNDLDQAVPGDSPIVRRPKPVSGVSVAVQVAVTRDRTIARLSDGTLRGWGGGFGSGSALSGASGAVDVALGGSFGCFRTAAGGVRCWGVNDVGQLGNGTTTAASPPSFATVTGITATGALSLGPATSFVFVGTDLKGWGRGVDGELGLGSADHWTAVTVFPGATQVTGGISFTCVRLSSGGVRCSGKNSHGQLGDGTTVGKTSPVDVTGLSSVVQVAAGSRHACALLSDGSVRCWGDNAAGQLGNGTTAVSSTPVSVTGLANAKRLFAGDALTCALLTDDVSVKCWGMEEGLGNGVEGGGNATTPVSVAW